MIDKDIETLDVRAAAHPLNGLEAQIWRGVDARLKDRQLSRAVMSCQAAVLALAVVSSVLAGTHVGMSANRAAPPALLVPGDLTLSSRLIGR